jgi:exo-1,4-beta-D-glucosaminidase
VPSAAYASAKKACGEPLHPMLSFDDGSVWVTSARNAPAGGDGGGVRLEGFTTAGVALFNTTLPVPPLNATGGARLGYAPPSGLGAGRTYFVRLTLVDAGGAPAGTPNTYALSTDPDVLDWSKSSWFDTACESYANLTELRALPPVQLAVTATPLSPNATRVDISLPAGAPGVAFFIRARLLDAKGADVAPAMWSDNFATLRPGEVIRYTVDYDGGAVANPPTTVEVTPFNNEAGAALGGGGGFGDDP